MDFSGSGGKVPRSSTEISMKDPYLIPQFQSEIAKIELFTPSLAQPPKTLWFDTKITIFNRIFGSFGYQKLWSRTRSFRDETLGFGLDGENGILKSLGLVSPPRPPKLNSRTRSRLENSGLVTLCCQVGSCFDC